MLDIARIAAGLTHWFSEERRPLPWRPTNLMAPRDPYATWISETMLQQTRVDAVIAHYQRWMKRFPSIADLACADVSEVLQHWQGLGYYSRARNLHKTAQILMDHGGQFPSTRLELLDLPGIGEYTAGAILSLALQKNEPILDGNLVRIFSRWNQWEQLPTQGPQWKRQYWNLAAEFAQLRTPHIINEALMEFGALVCTPQNPSCLQCVIREHCQAFQQKSVEKFPPRTNKRAPISVEGFLLCIRSADKILLERCFTGLLAGQWKLPLVETGSLDTETPSAKELHALFPKGIRGQKQAGKLVRHAITHHRITLRLCSIDGVSEQTLTSTDRDWMWTPLQDIRKVLINSLSLKGLDASAPRKTHRSPSPHQKPERMNP